MKPSVTFEFDLADVQFMRPVSTTSPSQASTTVIRDTLLLRDKAWSNGRTVAIYVVMDGTHVVPLAIPDGTTVKIEVTA